MSARNFIMFFSVDKVESLLLLIVLHTFKRIFHKIKKRFIF